MIIGIFGYVQGEISTRCEATFRARLGGDAGDDKSVSILSRVLDWVDGVGIVYEADQRHGALVARGLGMNSEIKSVGTPLDERGY